MDKWPAYARLSTVAPASHLPTAPTPPHNHAPKGSISIDKGVKIGREMGVAVPSDLTVVVHLTPLIAYEALLGADMAHDWGEAA
jgi:hypothetical protein